MESSEACWTKWSTPELCVGFGESHVQEQEHRGSKLQSLLIRRRGLQNGHPRSRIAGQSSSLVADRAADVNMLMLGTYSARAMAASGLQSKQPSDVFQSEVFARSQIA